MYLALANRYDDSTRNIDSKIYKWNGTSFVEFQSIPTNGALGWESFVIDGEFHLAVANYYNDSTWNINSKIYKAFQKSTSDGLLAYFPFNSSTNDMSGHGNDGARYGTSYALDRLGNERAACDFDGVDDYLKIYSGPKLQGSSQVTLAAWVRSSSTTGTGYSRVIEIGTDSSDSTGLVLDTTECGGFEGTVRAWIHADGERKGSTTTAGDFTNYNDDVWHFLAFTYDGSTTALYVDGVAKDANVASGVIDSPPLCLIGQHNFSSPDNLDSFGGNIDDIRIYGRALSGVEIQMLYHEGCSQADFDEDGILDDGDGSGLFGDNPCTGGNTESCDDNCPHIPNPDQEDTDGDGVGDVCEQVISDFDGDGDVDGTDLANFAYAFANDLPAAHLNGDTFINAQDVQIFAEEFGGADCPGP